MSIDPVSRSSFPDPKTELPQGEYDLLVLGGGIIGLACALEEALRGKRVAVIDSGDFGRKASWAAAGILNARAGLLGNSPFREFHLRSVASYPEWIARVDAASGMRVPYERTGDYQVFPLSDAASRRALEEREDQLDREKATAFSVRDAWPDFLAAHGTPAPVRVFHYPGEATVQNRILLEALEAALRRLDAGLFPRARLTGFATGNETAGRRNALSGEGWRLNARQVLIAAGTGCNEILGLLGLALPLFPVKGQLALLPRFHAENTMIHGVEKFYLVPRGDKLVAGATTEPRVADVAFDAVGETTLARELARLFPNVKPEWTDTWTGLRPRTPDRMPVMGWVDRGAGVAIAAGHYKSGISLAPLTARCLSALLHGEKPPADLEPFSPARRGGVQKVPRP